MLLSLNCGRRSKIKTVKKCTHLKNGRPLWEVLTVNKLISDMVKAGFVISRLATGNLQTATKKEPLFF